MYDPSASGPSRGDEGHPFLAPRIGRFHLEVTHLDSPSSVGARPADLSPESPAPSSSPSTVEHPLRLVLAILLALAGLSMLPLVRESPNVSRTLWISAAGFLLWLVVLRRMRGARVGAFRARVEIVRAHYVQAAVQFCIYLYWGWFTPEVAPVAPRIVAQLLFLYALQALLAWTRGREWTIGFGPLPIIFSTNLLLWFAPKWFALQFAMVAAGALGKEFVQWKRDGRATHIFNPSVFGQSLAAVLLIATGLTRDLTLGEHIAYTFESVPHFLIVLFALGLVVQYLFGVTLMTLAAAATLAVINVTYTHFTGIFYFSTLNIGATIFLGLHLLVTDPATSPRTNLGKVLFGVGYAVLYSGFFGLFREHDIPLFWDKLLPVPILNLSVRAIDRLTGSGILGRIDQAWRSALPAARLNLVHMGVWAALFLSMLGTGFIEGSHRGQTLEFWKEAYDAGNDRAGRTYLEMVRVGVARGSPRQLNLLGVEYLNGKLVEANPAAAAQCFAESCAGGYLLGCQNVLGQFLTTQTARSPQDVERAITHLEAVPQAGRDAATAYFLGVVHEFGVYRKRDLDAALADYRRACELGHAEACSRIARLERQIEAGTSPASRPAR